MRKKREAIVGSIGTCRRRRRRRNQIDDNTLRRTNGNCLSLAVNTLKNIEWKNYDISELIANIICSFFIIFHKNISMLSV
jgi:hypothetical protein